VFATSVRGMLRWLSPREVVEVVGSMVGMRAAAFYE
jgi:hypothetical protein